MISAAQSARATTHAAARDGSPSSDPDERVRDDPRGSSRTRLLVTPFIVGTIRQIPLPAHTNMTVGGLQAALVRHLSIGLAPSDRAKSAGQNTPIGA